MSIFIVIDEKGNLTVEDPNATGQLIGSMDRVARAQLILKVGMSGIDPIVEIIKYRNQVNRGK